MRSMFINPARKLLAALRTARQLPLLAGLFTIGCVDSALAALPSAVAPGAGVAAGDYIAIMQQYWKQGVAFIVLAVGAYGFVEVSGGAITKFGEWREGKANLTELKWYFALAVVVLVAVVYLLTTAAGIL